MYACIEKEPYGYEFSKDGHAVEVAFFFSLSLSLLLSFLLPAPHPTISRHKYAVLTCVCSTVRIEHL